MCVWEPKTESLEQHYHSSVCVCVRSHSSYIPQCSLSHRNTLLWFMSSLSPALATLSNQQSLSLSLCLSFSVKVGLISIKQDLRCNPVKWACDGNNPAQGRLTPCESVCAFLFLEKLISCHLKVFLWKKKKREHTMIYGGSVCVRVARTSHSHPPDIPLPVSDTLPTTWSVKMCLRMRTRMCLRMSALDFYSNLCPYKI